MRPILENRLKYFESSLLLSCLCLCIAAFIFLDSWGQSLVAVFHYTSLWVLIGEAVVRCCRFFGDFVGANKYTLTQATFVARNTLFDSNKTTVLFFVIIVTFTALIDHDNCTASEAHTMMLMNPLDYGSAMAYSYFYGYLKLTLPSRGDGNRGLMEKIDIFLDEQKLTDSVFPIKKLVILVPESGYCHPKLNDDPGLLENMRNLEPCRPLPDTLRDRAGTEQRVYRGCAYRITVADEPKKFMYVFAEGATPLLTFREAFSSNSSHAAHLKKHREDVTAIFCHRLRQLIAEDPECQHLIEVINYDDNNTNVYYVLRDLFLAKRME